MKECPVCRIPLDEIPKYGVIVDICSNCRGIWLDRGELEKVLSLVSDTYDRYGHHHEDHHRKHDYHCYDDDDERYHRRKKKLSIFDIFDFD